jgi:hypothetical protein
MSYLKDREIWLSNVPTGNPPAGYFWKFIQNGKVVVRDSSGNNQMMIATSGSQSITGSLTVTEGITGTVSSASYVEYSGVANKPTLVSGSSQIIYSGLTGIPSGIVSGSSQVTFLGLSSIPSGIVSGSGQVNQFGYATTGSNGFNGSQSITGSLTVTGQVIAQTLNVQQVTSSIVYSSGSNIFGNTVSNTHLFTGSLSVSGSITSTSTMTGTNFVTNGTTLYGVTLKGRSADNYGAIGYYSSDGVTRYGYIQSHSTNGGQLNITSDGGGQVIMDNRGVVVTSALYGNSAMFGSDFLSNETSKVGISFASGHGQINSWGANTSTYGGLKFQLSVSNGSTFNALTLTTAGSTFSNTETTLNFNPQTNLLASYYYLNFGGGSIMYRNTTDIYFGSNAKYGSAGTVVANYTSANGMGLLTMDGGMLRWQANNTSVTAGTAYSVPIRFAINGDGNVGIGTATPNLSAGAAGSTILTVSATTSARNGVLELNGTRTNSTDISGYVRFFNNGAATPLADIRAIRGSSDTSGDLAFTTADTERVRITSGGEVNIGGFATVFPVLTVKGIASSPHIGSTWSVSANQDGTGRTIIGTAGQGRSMYFENNGNIVIPNNTLTVGSSLTAATITGTNGVNTVSTVSSIPFTSWTTLVTIDSNTTGMYLVVIGLTGGGGALTDWTATGIVYTNGSTAAWLTGPTNASLVQLRISGLAIQVYQNGTNPSISLSYKLLKIS